MTEKNYNPKQKERKAMEKQEAVKIEEPKAKKKDTEEKQEVKSEQEKKTEEKKKIIVKKAPKKTEVVVKCANIPVSTKYARDICKFIKGKKIENAIFDLEEVAKMKRAVPMKGEIPHRKGKIMSGRFPVRATRYFIKALKGLKGNSNNHDLENPFISEAMANIGERPFGRFGSRRKKRSHLRIVAKERKIIEKKDKKEREN